MNAPVETSSFADLGLPKPLLKTLADLGYEIPTPIQASCIPQLLAGHDLIGQAQTGTGKTAAFALPLLAGLDLKALKPQLMVLVPTRELAIQVAEAFQSYASGMRGFHVLPVYGGQSYDIQLKQLRRGPQVIVGTPGRVMDHIERKTLVLDSLRTLVLDEADEMLRMGFIDDIEWILDRVPQQRQIALFSATMPKAIQKVAEKYLQQPRKIKVESKTQTATTITQYYVQVSSGYRKLDALTRILESSDFDAVLVFVRTKTATVDLAEKLEARGYACEALNGDIAQKMRERTIDRIKTGRIDIIVATDVAARGLDVDRISHVINYDIPYDAESYVHRIGRTGRAGRKGEAVLFVTGKERHLLRSIEKMTSQRIEALKLPSNEDINQQRLARFKARIGLMLENEELTVYRDLVESFVTEQSADPLDVAAALVRMVQGDEPLLLDLEEASARRGERKQRAEREAGDSAGRPRRDKKVIAEARALKDHPEIKMRRYRLAVGYRDGARPGHIVGAIANEAELDSRYIGNIDIYDDFTLIDLPDGMPGETFRTLKKTRVAGRPLAIAAFKPEHSDIKESGSPESKVSRAKKHKPKHQKRKGKRPAVAKRKLQSRSNG